MNLTIGEKFVSDRLLGIVRSLLALSTLITLLANDARHLFFFENEAVISGEACRNLGFFCFFNAFGSGNIYIAKAIAITVLAVVISGWFPRWTALPHWVVSFGFAHAVALPDGGDQINAVLTFLIMPLAIFDGRKNHWKSRASMPVKLGDEGVKAMLLRAATLLCRIQCHFIYIDAAVDKMKVIEWRNDTALYYWFQDPVVGPPFKGPQIWVDLFNAFPIVLVMVTWSVLVLEILIGMSWMWSQRARAVLCAAGIVFHLSIIINHGLTSFFFTMTAVLFVIAFSEKQYSNKESLV